MAAEERLTQARKTGDRALIEAAIQEALRNVEEGWLGNIGPRGLYHSELLDTLREPTGGARIAAWVGAVSESRLPEKIRIEWVNNGGTWHQHYEDHGADPCSLPLMGLCCAGAESGSEQHADPASTGAFVRAVMESAGFTVAQKRGILWGSSDAEDFHGSTTADSCNLMKAHRKNPHFAELALAKDGHFEVLGGMLLGFLTSATTPEHRAAVMPLQEQLHYCDQVVEKLHGSGKEQFEVLERELSAHAQALREGAAPMRPRSGAVQAASIQAADIPTGEHKAGAASPS